MLDTDHASRLGNANNPQITEDEKRNIIDDSNVLTILTNSTNTTFFRIKHRISRVKDPGSNDNNVLTIITVITTIMF